MGIISGSVSFRVRFGDHFRVGDHFGVGIISGAVHVRTGDSIVCLLSSSSLRVLVSLGRKTRYEGREISAIILGDPGANSGGEGKSKRAETYGKKKSKERREEPLGTMSYQTSSKRLPPFWLLIGQKNTKAFWHQSESRTAATVWNFSGKTLSPGALLAVLYFSLRQFFPPV